MKTRRKTWFILLYIKVTKNVREKKNRKSIWVDKKHFL